MWEDASAEPIENPEVQSALSVFLVNESTTTWMSVPRSSEAARRLQAACDDGRRRRAKPTTEAVHRLMEAPRVQQLFVNASAAAQQQPVNVLEDKTGHGISTGDGVVTLDLGELVTEIGTQLGVSDSALAKIPPDTGTITVMSSDRLSAAQTAVKSARVLSVVLLVLVLALYALAIYLAHGERRETLRNIGFALVLIGLIVLVVRRVTGNEVIDALTTPQGEAGGRQAWLIASELLSQLGWAEVLYGAIVVAATIFAGPTAAATSVRRAGRAGAQRAPDDRLGRRRRRLPSARPVGRHARAPHLVGHPAARRADRHRRRGAAPPNAARVPPPERRCRRHGGGRARLSRAAQAPRIVCRGTGDGCIRVDDGCPFAWEAVVRFARAGTAAFRR